MRALNSFLSSVFLNFINILQRLRAKISGQIHVLYDYEGNCTFKVDKLNADIFGVRLGPIVPKIKIFYKIFIVFRLQY